MVELLKILIVSQIKSESDTWVDFTNLDFSCLPTVIAQSIIFLDFYIAFSLIIFGQRSDSYSSFSTFFVEMRYFFGVAI